MRGADRSSRFHPLPMRGGRCRSIGSVRIEAGRCVCWEPGIDRRSGIRVKPMQSSARGDERRRTMRLKKGGGEGDHASGGGEASGDCSAMKASETDPPGLHEAINHQFPVSFIADQFVMSKCWMEVCVSSFCSLHQIYHVRLHIYLFSSCAPITLLPLAVGHATWCLARLPSICVHFFTWSPLLPTNYIVLKSSLSQFCAGGVHFVCGRFIQAFWCMKNANEFNMCFCRWCSSLWDWFSYLLWSFFSLTISNFSWKGDSFTVTIIHPVFSIYIFLKLCVCVIHTMKLFISIWDMHVT